MQPVMHRVICTMFGHNTIHKLLFSGSQKSKDVEIVHVGAKIYLLSSVGQTITTKLFTGISETSSCCLWHNAFW